MLSIFFFFIFKYELFSDKEKEALKDKERIRQQLEQEIKRKEEKSKKLLLESSKLKNKISHKIQKNEDELICLNMKLHDWNTSCIKTPPKSKTDLHENSLTKLVSNRLNDLEINKIHHENHVKINPNAETDLQKDDLNKLE